MVIVGVEIDSDAVIETVITSPAFALLLSTLLEAILTELSDGAVLSKLTLLPSVVAVIAVPAFPARSEKVIFTGTFPSVSVDTKV